jgi:hypothetical protein
MLPNDHVKIEKTTASNLVALRLLLKPSMKTGGTLFEVLRMTPSSQQLEE